MSTLTHFLQAVSQGDPKAAEELLPLVYDELRKLAAHKMAHEAPGHTLQPTALVHEAWLRLAGPEAQAWENSRHFFSAAAEAMRRILIERARRKARQRHGGGLERLDIDHVNVASEDDVDTMLFVDEALENSPPKTPACAELIKLHFFTGVPNHQAARLLGMSERTAKRNWAYARAWVAKEIERLRAG